jgi:tetratricopeptide (TPR) repeat protein
MIPFLANIDLAFKNLAPRTSDWQSILPEIAVAGLALFCLLQAMTLPKALRYLIPTTARIGLALVAIMSVSNAPWTLEPDVETFGGLLCQDLPIEGVRVVFLLSALLTSLLAARFLRDRDAAVADARRATDLRPDDLRYRIVAAQVLSERGTLADVDEALRQARAGLRWAPNDPIVLDTEAALLLQRDTITGDPADTAVALDAWRRLTALDPYRSAWQVQLGRAAALAGDVDLARTAWTTAADLNPADTTPANLLAALDAQTASAAGS